MQRTLFDRQARYEGGLHEVARDVFAWLQPNGEWGESNAAVVAGDGEALLVDTQWDLPLTRRMLDAVAARVDRPIRTLVNTHSDGDHVYGNQLVEDAEIVATRAAATTMDEESPSDLRRFKALGPRLRQVGGLPLPVVGSLALPVVPRLPVAALGRYVDRMLGPFDFADVHRTLPTQVFSGELTLSVGVRQVRLIDVGPAHTAGDLIAHVPDAATVIAGDVLFIGSTPVMWAGPAWSWVAAIDRLLELEPKVVVPGHGPVCGLAEAREVRDYLEWLETNGIRRLEAGDSVPEAARALLFSDEFRSTPWAGWDLPERIVISLETIDRHRRGRRPAAGARDRIVLFSQLAVLAEELVGTGPHQVRRAR